MTGYFQRDLAPAVGKALRNMPVVVITGLRQSGKTTFLQHEFPTDKRRFITSMILPNSRRLRLILIIL